MQMTKFKNKLSLILCIVLIAAMTLFTTACSNNTKTDAENQTEQGNSETDAEEQTASNAEENVLGEGETEFSFTVTDAEGNETSFIIRTDKKTVGEALLDVNLIAGDAGEFGLYVKTVNGITVDYDKDGKYWAFYVDGEYAVSGVDQTEITDGAAYSFKVES